MSHDLTRGSDSYWPSAGAAAHRPQAQHTDRRRSTRAALLRSRIVYIRSIQWSPNTNLVLHTPSNRSHFSTWFNTQVQPRILCYYNLTLTRNAAPLGPSSPTSRLATSSPTIPGSSLSRSTSTQRNHHLHCIAHDVSCLLSPFELLLNSTSPLFLQLSRHGENASQLDDRKADSVLPTN
jgi:hypothetical protein